MSSGVIETFSQGMEKLLTIVLLKIASPCLNKNQGSSDSVVVLFELDVYGHFSAALRMDCLSSPIHVVLPSIGFKSVILNLTSNFLSNCMIQCWRAWHASMRTQAQPSYIHGKGGGTEAHSLFFSQQRRRR